LLHHTKLGTKRYLEKIDLEEYLKKIDFNDGRSKALTLRN